jgi:hypothetical protein
MCARVSPGVVVGGAEPIRVLSPFMHLTVQKPVAALKTASSLNVSTIIRKYHHQREREREERETYHDLVLLPEIGAGSLRGAGNFLVHVNSLYRHCHSLIKIRYKNRSGW